MASRHVGFLMETQLCWPVVGGTILLQGGWLEINCLNWRRNWNWHRHRPWPTFDWVIWTHLSYWSICQIAKHMYIVHKHQKYLMFMYLCQPDPLYKFKIWIPNRLKWLERKHFSGCIVSEKFCPYSNAKRSHFFRKVTKHQVQHQWTGWGAPPIASEQISSCLCFTSCF